MNEINLIKKIKNTLKSQYIGDDCAYLKDLGIVISQDSLVEDIHFNKHMMSPYQMGYKSVMVNLSDIAASGAKPAYLTVALSLPKEIKDDAVVEFYEGAKNALQGLGVEIVGGDVTGSDKLYISISVIGKTLDRKISSRSHAKVGHKIITSGVHGSSAAGLRILQNNLEPDKDLIKAHLMPVAQIDFAKQISEQIQEDYAMMDTSDGLFDALFKIGSASECTMSVDFERILYDPKIKEYFSDYKDLILFGGEDYQIVATVPVELLPSLKDYIIIGEVLPKEDCVIKLNTDNKVEKFNDLGNKCFNHFG